tara:strand:+ start:179 stop:1369 length:1191 start_codon:yes stop_codon:yes gene_type:complete
MSISKILNQQMKNSSWIRKMFEEGNRLKYIHGDDNVFDLSLGNPLLEPPSEFKNKLIEIIENSEEGSHRYMPNAGFNDVRKKIAKNISKETNLTFSENEIIMTVGAAGAINVILRSILDPGDEVVVISPYFAEYIFYIQNNNGKVIETGCDNHWNPDIQQLKKSITKKTKAVIINSPNNPTGVVYDKSIIESIGTLLSESERKYMSHIYLISDEPYRKIIFDDTEYPFVYNYHKHSIVATSHSKDLGLAGERIGYISVNPSDDNRSNLINALNFSMRTLGFVNAPALMQKVVAEIQNTSVDIDIYRKKRDFLYKNLIDIGYECTKPSGAFYLFPKSPCKSDLDFVEKLKEFLVLVVPGSGFGTEGFFRISYCVPDSVLKGSIKGFRKTFEYFKTIK